MRLLLGLLERARRAGAAVLDGCAVQAIGRTRAGFEVLTSRGTVEAGKMANLTIVSGKSYFDPEAKIKEVIAAGKQ